MEPDASADAGGLEKSGSHKGFLTDSAKDGKDSEDPGAQGDMVEIKLKEGKRRRRSVSFDIKESTSVQVTKQELQAAQLKHGGGFLFGRGRLGPLQAEVAPREHHGQPVGEACAGDGDRLGDVRLQPDGV